MVAILFAAFSMAATIVAIFRHEADLERPLSHVGIEGMVISVCVMTLHDRIDVFIHCFVFLFIEANGYFISTTGPFGLCGHSTHHFYSFRGVTLSDPSRKSFDDYKRLGILTLEFFISYQTRKNTQYCCLSTVQGYSTI